MLRRFATTLCVAFLLALFLPLALPGPSVAPARAVPVSHTESIMRLAPVVVSNLFLPQTADAQSRVSADTSSDAQPSTAASSTPIEASGGHSARFWAAIVALVIVLAWACWRLSKRGNDSSYSRST